jgi:hypothetical protein
MSKTHLALLILPILMILAVPAAAHTWQCPTEVRASSEGAFQFDVVLTIEDVAVYAGSYTEIGTDNVDGVNMVADGFCIEELAPGTELRMTVHGTLIDPEQPGAVHIDQFVCGLGDTPDTYWDREVTILPAVVATDQSTFGMLKARFVD